MIERPMYQDGYIRIGDGSEYMDVAIDMQHANYLREAVVETFAPLSGKVHGLQAVSGENDETFLTYGAFFGAKTRSIPTVDFVNEPSVFIGAHLRQTENDAWQLSITRNRYARLEGGDAEQRIRTFFKIICWGEEVVEAKRTVKVAKVTSRVLSTSSQDNSLTVVEHHYKRIGFTAPVQPADCETMAQYIAQHRKRITTERGL